MATRKPSRPRSSRLRVTAWLPKSRWTRWLLGAIGLGAIAFGVVGFQLSRRVDEFLADRGPGPLRVFTDSTLLRDGVSVEGSHLVPRLRRLGYRETQEKPRQPGDFHVTRNRIDILLRPFVDPAGDHAAELVRLDVAGGIVQSVRGASGAQLDYAVLEPELLGTYSGGVLGERKTIALGEFPRHVVAAVLAAEDARFATHPGIDPVGLLRAAWVNLRGGGVRQGGSTITQQLAKNLFLTPERTFVRKATETVLALILEARMTKEEILEAYLNNVYLGQSESIGIYGVAQGARAFFGKDVRDLTPGEAATISGVIHSPNADSPLRHPERAKLRRDKVLDLMAENSWLTAEQVAAEREQPIKLQKRLNQVLEAPFFVDEVLRRVAKMGYDTNLVRGLAVYTTLDLEVQHAAERAVAVGLESLEKAYPRLAKSEAPVEGSMVVLEAQSGYVRGLVGGRDFARSQFNRVTRSKRQPGSAFKPFVYLAAIDDPDDSVTPATVLRDEPIVIRTGGGDWSPENYDGRYLGEVTVREALEDSRNVPTVELAQRVGMRRVIELAQSAGLGEIPPLPAVALGSAEVSLIDLAGAYTVFPNLGAVVRPALIRAVVSGDGTVLYRDQLRSKRIATAAASFVTGHLLEGVVEEGTGAAVRRLGITQTVAGKTGTTNDTKDGWFIGYSPSLVAGVWVGFDDGTPIGLTGAKAALPLWVNLMKAALKGTADQRFEVPSGIVFRNVDRHTGLLSTSACPDSIQEAFLSGTEPMTTCDGQNGIDMHGAPVDRRRVFNWFERIFEGR